MFSIPLGFRRQIWENINIIYLDEKIDEYEI
jgi:hypothetical protein